MRVIVVFMLFFTCIYAAYPSKPIDIIVGFGRGGSVDRMTRILKPYLEKELNQKINIINKKGDGSLVAIERFFLTPQDGYTLLASSFFPYIPLAIKNKKLQKSIDDFALLNIQWFDVDLIAVYNSSNIKSFDELIQKIKETNKPLKVALMYHSSGEITLNLLLHALNIPKTNVKYIYFNGGEKARESLLKQKVDFLIIGAQGSKGVREFISPLAILSNKRNKKWDAPAINEVLKKYNVQMPIITGSIRGYSVSNEFKTKYPYRYKVLYSAFKKVLAMKKVQKELKQNGMGYGWLGDKNSNKLLKKSASMLESYDLLLK